MAYEIFGSDLTEIKAEPAKVHASLDSSEKEPSSDRLEGRNAVIEAIKAGRTIDKVYIQDGIKDGAISGILSKLKGSGASVSFVKKQKLDMMSETGHHQGIIAQTTAYEYAQLEDIFDLAKKRGEPPFIIILDEIEDPHNLGAIIRTANICGAHGVIIPKHRATGLTATVVRASAGAVNFTPVVKVTNISNTIEELKLKGLWFACADMDGEVMYKCNLTGAIGLVIGNEGSGVSRLVKEKCDYIVSIPMKGQINSLNASVAAGILAYEIVRQRCAK
ncbi:23S rRNA (guanosine2251-2'-O)-methyltransferase [Lachnospiraceae bacterium]|nr:23S rRNA (guanosine2251-2'-O)-methyltransferase [Lachnospiraceae bacterium]